MRTPILLFSLFVGTLANAQRSGIFAVTDLTAGGAAWYNIREASPDGEAGRLILGNQAFSGSRVELQTQQKKSVDVQSLSDVNDLPLNSGVAALAFDRVHNRLYFSTMFTGDVRYINLGKDANTYYQVGKVYDAIPLANNVPVSHNNQGPVITRMVAAADGYVYGLSNDGNSFFRVSTSAKKPVVENLGKLIDDPANNGMSVHASCSSWGGDMVACASGDIYIFSMYQHVFRVNPSNKVATYLGRVTGLPGDFTINGAAVQEDGTILLSSAGKAGTAAILASVDDLKAEVKEISGWFNTSDLASSHMLNDRKSSVVVGEFERSSRQSGVGVFPNPATNGEIIVHFKDGMNGRYSLDLFDVAGGSKFQSSVHLNGQAQRVPLRTGTLAQSIYLLRVLSPEKREVETIKVMIR